MNTDERVFKLAVHLVHESSHLATERGVVCISHGWCVSEVTWLLRFWMPLTCRELKDSWWTADRVLRDCMNILHTDDTLLETVQHTVPWSFHESLHLYAENQDEGITANNDRSLWLNTDDGVEGDVLVCFFILLISKPCANCRQLFLLFCTCKNTIKWIRNSNQISEL